MKNKALTLAMSLIAIHALSAPLADACTRFTYNGMDNSVITGRSMDWIDNLHTDLWAFPAGISRSGNGTDKNSVHWVSKYGSVIASGYKIAATDGMNTAGLDVNLLYLTGTIYAQPKSGNKNLAIFNWVQYMLDNYATVDEAVKDFGKNKLNLLVTDVNGRKMDLHMSITDASGDNAIFEYINGKLVIHHSKQYTVMTNEPPFEQQLALNAYWKRMDGKFLPGTEEPDDRFVRTSYYVNNAQKTADNQQQIATVFSIIRNASIPFELSKDPSHPNVYPTLWRTVADLKNKVYYFEETNKPNVFWVDMNKLNLKSGAPTKKLSLDNGEIYAGEVSQQFVTAQSFSAPQINTK